MFFIWTLPFGLVWIEVVSLWEGRNGWAVHRPEQYRVWKLTSSPGYSGNCFHYCKSEADVLHRASGLAWDLEHKGVTLSTRAVVLTLVCGPSKPALSHSVNAQHGGKGGQQLTGTRRWGLFSWVLRGSRLLDKYEDSLWKCHFILIWGFKYYTKWHGTKRNGTKGPWEVWRRENGKLMGENLGESLPQTEKKEAGKKSWHMLYANKSCPKSFSRVVKASKIIYVLWEIVQLSLVQCSLATFMSHKWNVICIWKEAPETKAECYHHSNKQNKKKEPTNQPTNQKKPKPPFQTKNTSQINPETSLWEILLPFLPKLSGFAALRKEVELPRIYQQVEMMWSTQAGVRKSRLSYPPGKSPMVSWCFCWKQQDDFSKSSRRVAKSVAKLGLDWKGDYQDTVL